jgi:AcrR family transcriptional regulator
MMTTQRPTTLRERKKVRTRRALAETAVTLFTERGFDGTPLDVLLDAVEVSRRTFFRHYRSKEDVALTAFTEFWDTAVLVLEETTPRGKLVAVMRDTLLRTLQRMDQDWHRRFPATVRLNESSPALTAHSLRHGDDVRTEIACRFAGQPERELDLLLEFCLAAWRRALDEWQPDCAPRELPACIERAFAAMEGSLYLTAKAEDRESDR